MSFLDQYRTESPLSRRLPVDDAYSAWFNASSRCSHALREWFSAPESARAEAYRVYRFELELEEAAAAELAQHAERALSRLANALQWQRS